MVVFYERVEQDGLHESTKLSMCQHGRRQCVPQGRTRDSEASFTMKSF